MTSADPSPRPYDSSLRRERADQTRERILEAATELLRSSSIRDWTALTVRAVAGRAGVSERTVYRHFAKERGLRDEVLDRLARASGIDLAALRLDDVADVAARVVRHVSQYPVARPIADDPTLDLAGRRQREALLGAVGRTATERSEREQVAAAAVLDVLWSPATFERLTGDWRLDTDAAIDAITWAIDLVVNAVRS